MCKTSRSMHMTKVRIAVAGAGQIAFERTDPLARQIEHLAAVIRGDAKPLVSGRDGLQNLRVTDAIAEAAKSGKSVEISVN
jgi:predicted dehydrogenase